MPELSIEEKPLRWPKQQYSKPRSTGIKGPLKVIRLCVLSIVLPVILIAFPLYLRYRVYGHQMYPLAMSDMRLIDNKISTTWCQRQLVKVNTTFNAYLLPQVPTVSHELKPLSMVRHLNLEDDMKEYWGFYLLKGSTVTVSTCVRWPGASLIVIRGHKHLHDCAYIGDDSSEEIEELMRNIREQALPLEDDENSPANTPGKMTRHRPWVEFHNPNHEKQENHTLDHEQEVEDHNTDPKVMNQILDQLRQQLAKKEKEKELEKLREKEHEHIHKHRDQTINKDEKQFLTIREPKEFENSEEIFQIVLDKLQKLGDKGKDVLEKLNEQFKSDHNVTNLKHELESIMKKPEEQPTIKTRGRTSTKQNIKYQDAIDEELHRRKRELVIETAMKNRLDEDIDSTENAAIEEGFNPDGIADHRGTFNETTLNDRSNSEFWSSFSSSEEALLNCAGLILNLPLTPHRFCERNRSVNVLEEASLANTVTYKVPSNGYYFFVFNSENEVQENYIRVHFNLQKTVYNVSSCVSHCSNSTGNCALDLKFFSNEKLVLELPVRNNETLWNQEFVVLSECEPRTAIYLICVLAVPIAIVLFAFQ